MSSMSQKMYFPANEMGIILTLLCILRVIVLSDLYVFPGFVLPVTTSQATASTKWVLIHMVT